MAKAQKQIMKKRTIFTYFGFPLLFAVISIGFCGCATDNEFLVNRMHFPRKSDKIPGLVSPRERSEIIRQKADAVEEGSATDREIIVAQLVLEYRESGDPNIRKDCMAAIAKIPHPRRIDNLKMGLSDENTSVRITACRGMVRNIAESQGLNNDVEHTLRQLVMADPDVDVRLAAIQCMRKAGKKASPETLAILEQCLSDKRAAIQHETMDTLKECTGKDYGPNVDRWLAHFEHQRGDSDVPAPKERSWAEKLPKPEYTMFR